jgi:hypothetical protein
LFDSQTVVKEAKRGMAEAQGKGILLKNNTLYLRVEVAEDATAHSSFSDDCRNFTRVGEPFTAKKGKCIGAKVGIFAVRTGMTRETGYADFDWFRIE